MANFTALYAMIQIAVVELYFLLFNCKIMLTAYPGSISAEIMVVLNHKTMFEI